VPHESGVSHHCVVSAKAPTRKTNELLIGKTSGRGYGFFWCKLSWHASLHPWWKLLCQTNLALVARRRSFGTFVNDPFFLLDLYAYASLNSCLKPVGFSLYVFDREQYYPSPTAANLRSEPRKRRADLENAYGTSSKGGYRGGPPTL